VLLAASAPTLAQEKKGPVLRLRCDREDALYKVGAKATFHIESTADGEATYRFSDDGYTTIEEGKTTLQKGKSYSLELTTQRRGFSQLPVEQRVPADDKTKKLVPIAAAGFDPTKTQPTAKMPADFDDFWNAGLKELAKVPANPKLEHVPNQ